MFARTLAKVLFIWLATLACDVSQPLPPPQLPASQSLSCVSVGCSEGLLCHAAVGGGVCAAACSENTACDAIVPGYVCHPGLSSTCAPSCSDKAACLSIAAGTRCNAAKLCEPDPDASVAKVRVFNAAFDKTVRVTRGDIELTAALASGQASSYVNVPAGDVSLQVYVGGSQVRALTGQSFGAGRVYTVVVWQRSGRFDITPMQTSTSAETPADRAVLAYVSASDRLHSQTAVELTQLKLGAGSPVYSSVPHGAPKNGATVVPGKTSFSVEAIDVRPFIRGDLTFEGGKNYLLVLWRGLGGDEVDLAPYAQASLLDDSGVVSTQASSALRFVFASETSNSSLVLDGKSFNFSSQAQAVDPPQSFYPIVPGRHTLRVTGPGDDFLLDTEVEFVAGQSYTVLTGGALPSGAVGATFYSNTPPSDLPAGMVQVRAAHFCVANPGDSLDLLRNGVGTGVSGVPFTELSAPVLIAREDMSAFSTNFGAESGAQSMVGVNTATLVCTANKLRVLTDRATRPLP